MDVHLTKCEPKGVSESVSVVPVTLPAIEYDWLNYYNISVTGYSWFFEYLVPVSKAFEARIWWQWSEILPPEPLHAIDLLIQLLMTWIWFLVLAVRIQGNNSQSLGAGNAGEESNAAPHSASSQGGLPTPAALGEVTQSARQLLIEQAGECLMVCSKRCNLQVPSLAPY